MIKVKKEQIVKLENLFDFLKELGDLKYKQNFQIQDEPWKLFLSDIPQDDTNIYIDYCSRDDEDNEDEARVLLSIHKPTFSACPILPEILNGWLHMGWEKFDENPQMYAIRYRGKEENGEPVYEKFIDKNQRVQAYQKWMEIRTVWAEEQKKRDQVRTLFLRLYRLGQRLKQQAETLEFMVGNGMFMGQRSSGNSAAGQNVEYPLLLKRIAVHFDAVENKISLVDTERDAEFNSAILSDIMDINHEAVHRLEQEVNEQNYHPLDQRLTCDFLKFAIQELCPESQFLAENESIPAGTKDKIFLQDRPVFFVRKKVDGLGHFVDVLKREIEKTSEVPATLLRLLGTINRKRQKKNVQLRHLRKRWRKLVVKMLIFCCQSKQIGNSWKLPGKSKRMMLF